MQEKKNRHEALEEGRAARTTMPVVPRRAPSRAVRVAALEALIVTPRDNSGATHDPLSCDSNSVRTPLSLYIYTYTQVTVYTVRWSSLLR